MIDKNFSADIFNCKCRTTPDAGIAMQTFFSVPKNLQARILTFGIGAPSTLKRTAFEENDRSDSGSVVYAELLNIKNHAVIDIFVHCNSS